MAGDLLALMWAPFLMCLVLTGIHAYLGFHVLAREVVFVDIALAQIAALGATAAFLFGYDLETWASYAFALGFTILGALVLALTRSRRRHVSQEAVIGVVYAVSSAAAVLLADRSPHGAEHLRGMLVGSLLGGRIGARLLIGWGFGTAVSVLAILASATLDLPTGATVVCAFGLALLVLGVVMKLGARRLSGRDALAASAEVMAEGRETWR